MEDCLFVLDCTPGKDVESNQEKSFISAGTSEFDKSLGFEDVVGSEDQNGGKAANTFGKCFNCDGDHTLSDCKLEKNFAKIREARKRLRDSAAGSNVRYHEDSDTKDKFKPGKLSDELREALGLKDDQLPMHIYQMRYLGYPPGWLEELRVEEQIKIIDDNDSDCIEKVEHDYTKIIKYPGFNVQPPRGVYDECRSLGYPPFDSRKSGVEAMIRYLKEKARHETRNEEESRKRKKFKAATLDDSDCIILENVDEAEEVIMIDDFDEDDSLSALEEKKRKLLDALKQEDVDLPEDLQDSLKKDSNESQSSDSGTVSDIEGGEKTSQEVVFGTPVLTFSPFQKLPDLSSFSEGIGDHLPFENLPGHAGTFEKLRGVLCKIKDLKAQKVQKKV